jgi:membrane associated rhomboid family serine protease
MMPLRLTPNVRILVVICAVTFVIQQVADRFLGGQLLEWLALFPGSVFGGLRIWQLLTYAFVHTDVLNLILNLLMLVFVGSDLESTWGKTRFLRYYLICVFSAGLLYSLIHLVAGGSAGSPMVGASGGVYGLLMAYGIIYSERVLLFMMLFPMKAKHFVWILMAVELLSGLSSGRSGFSSMAPLGGMVAGLVVLWFEARALRMARGGGKASERRKPSGHLKLVIDNKKGRVKVTSEPGEGGEPPKTWH